MEYIEETDIRFPSGSDMEDLDLFVKVTSDILASSDMVKLNLGVSESSTAISSLLGLRLAPKPCLSISAALVVLVLYVDDVRVLVLGREDDGGGMEIFAPALVSVGTTSACRLFLLTVATEADERLCELCRDFSFGGVVSASVPLEGCGRRKLELLVSSEGRLKSILPG